MANKKVCFVIAPIGEPNSETRKRSDQILKHILKPIMSQFNYDTVRADTISEPGIITTQVIQHITDDYLVVADLTDRNPNVFYELAIRHVIRKPLIQLIRKDEQIPFDVANMRTIQIDLQDLDSVQEAKEEIIRQVKSIKENITEVDTPISVALDLKTLRQSGKPEQRSLGDLLRGVSNLERHLTAINKVVSNPELLLPPGYISTLFQKDAMRARFPTALSDRALLYIEKIIHDFDSLEKLSLDGRAWKKVYKTIHRNLRELHEWIVNLKWRPISREY